MLQALLAGIASIKAQQTRMNIIGNNLANVNTNAYKDSSVTFEDMVSQTINGGNAPTANLGGTNPVQLGLGVVVGATSTNTAQGSLSATNVPSDLALQGNGFFAVSNGAQVSYTRDGGFDTDLNGNLVQRSTGQRLLGWTADPTGKVDTTQQITGASTLQIPVGSATAVQATQNISLNGNLDATSAGTATFATQATAYDSLGGSHQITIQFSNHLVPPAVGAPAGATSQWGWTAYNGSVATGTVIGSSASAGNSPLYFDTSGSPVNGLAAGTFNKITLAASNGGSADTMNLDFTNLSQLSGSTSIAFKNQDGFPPGVLQNYSIGNDGAVTGIFSNGISRTLGQVAVSTFANPGGLSRLGNNLWSTSSNSGEPITTPPGQGAAGPVTSGFLEQSNVDIGTEFSNLIVTQRGFQANTKIVTTVDQMLDTLVNMKQ